MENLNFFGQSPIFAKNFGTLLFQIDTERFSKKKNTSNKRLPHLAPAPCWNCHYQAVAVSLGLLPAHHLHLFTCTVVNWEKLQTIVFAMEETIWWSSVPNCCKLSPQDGWHWILFRTKEREVGSCQEEQRCQDEGEEGACKAGLWIIQQGEGMAVTPSGSQGAAACEYSLRCILSS